MPLTDTTIRSLSPREKPFKVSDSAGLYLLVNPGGSRLWRFKYRYNGREKLLALGSYPLVCLKRAREKRDEARLQIVDGYDPSAERQKRRRQQFLEQGNSFADLAQEYVEKLKREGRAAQTLRKLEWLITLAEPRLGAFDVKEIEAQDVLAALRAVEAEGKFETATRLRSTIGAIIVTGSLASSETVAFSLLEPEETIGGPDFLKAQWVGQKRGKTLRVLPQVSVMPRRLILRIGFPGATTDRFRCIQTDTSRSTRPRRGDLKSPKCSMLHLEVSLDW